MLATEEVFRKGHPPFDQVLHGRHPNLAREAFGEHCPRHGSGVRELRDGPPAGDVGVDFTKWSRKRGIGKTGEQSLLLFRRRGRSEAERFDEQHLDEALQDQLAAGTLRVCFLSDQGDEAPYTRRAGSSLTDVDHRGQ